MSTIQGLTGIGYTAGAVVVAVAVGVLSCGLIARLYQKIVVVQAPGLSEAGKKLTLRKLEASRILALRKPVAPSPSIKLGVVVIGVYTMTKTLQVAGLILAVPNIVTYAAITSAALLALSALYQRTKKPIVPQTTTPLEKLEPGINVPSLEALEDRLKEGPLTITPDSPLIVHVKAFSYPEMKDALGKIMVIPKGVQEMSQFKDNDSWVVKLTCKEPTQLKRKADAAPTITETTLEKVRKLYAITTDRIYSIGPRYSLLIENIKFGESDSEETKIEKTKACLGEFMIIPDSVQITFRGNSVILASTFECALAPTHIVERVTLADLASRYNEDKGICTIDPQHSLLVESSLFEEGDSEEIKIRKTKDSLRFMVIPDSVKITFTKDGVLLSSASECRLKEQPRPYTLDGLRRFYAEGNTLTLSSGQRQQIFMPESLPLKSWEDMQNILDFMTIPANKIRVSQQGVVGTYRPIRLELIEGVSTHTLQRRPRSDA